MKKFATVLTTLCLIGLFSSTANAVELKPALSSENVTLHDVQLAKEKYPENGPCGRYCYH
ncbi:hypothetical protein CKF54_01005 [Psittacicella hinzii]|uniref:Uncharacterized protein n=1 Tax=Psittacicella hinzii TaxID=2028575 RepID=A0A3A1YAQ3_9GAMM|nr:hypothetical protein [Psittacicella hinzii]RIY34290.1 hypothetical protein CKF54_01005 [Psittacicella hinzii]